MANPVLELYFFHSCPYCQIVLRAINKLKIKVTLLDIHKDSAALKKLLDDTGRKTVPCLYVDGEPMHESGDIVNYLEKNQDNLAKN